MKRFPVYSDIPKYVTSPLWHEGGDEDAEPPDAAATWLDEMDASGGPGPLMGDG